MQKTKPGSRLGFAGNLAYLFLLSALIITITITALSTDGLCSPAHSPYDCPVDTMTSWSCQEQEAWKHICAGEDAKMKDIASGGCGKRTISQEFLSNIFRYKRYSEAIPAHGVHFIGAHFDKKIDLSHYRLDCPLVFEKCTFGDEVNLQYITSPCDVRIVGSTFLNKVDIGGAQIGGSLDITSAGGEQTDAPLTRNRFEGDLILQNARIIGEVFIGYSTFSKNLSMEGLQSNLFLQMEAIQCEGSTKLDSAKLTGLYILGGRFMGDVDMPFLDLNGSLFVYGKAEPPIFEKGIGLTSSHIAGALTFSNGVASKVDLSGAVVNGELRFEADFIEHSRSPDLSLHNAQIGTLSFPVTVGGVRKLDLIGCEYKRLNWIEENTGVSHDVSWLWEKNDPKEAIRWVKKGAVASDPGSGSGKRYYSAQPFRQLAGVLNQEGNTGLANDVLFAGKEAERSSSSGWRWWLLTMLRYTIGYGYEYYFVFCSTLVIIIAGSLMIWANGEGKGHGKVWCFVYSLDMLLPVLQLEKANYDIHPNGWARYYFYFHKAAGYLLASFIIAGITGLTK